MQAYINRIKEVNPLINAVVNAMFEEALEAASKIDQFLADAHKESDSYKQVRKVYKNFSINNYCKY